MADTRDHDGVRVLACLHRSHCGGGQLRTLWVAQALSGSDVEVIPHFPADDDDSYERLLHAAAVRRSRVHQPPFRRSLRLSLWAGVSLPGSVRLTMRAMRKLDITAAHVNGVTNVQPVIAAHLLGIPVIWHLNDMLTPKWLVRLMRPLLRLPTVTLAASAVEVLDHYSMPAAMRRECAILPVPVRPRPAPCDPLRSLAGIGVPSDARVVGSVGHLVPGKGWEDLLAATGRLMAHRRDIHLLIIGGAVPSQASYAEALIRDATADGLGARVHFLGHKDDVYTWLAMMDLFVMPSHSESGPMVVLEAMNAGVPLVSTQVGSVAKMLGDVPAPTVPPADVDALYSAIKGLLETPPPDLRAIGTALRERAREFSARNVAAQHLRLYERVLGRDLRTPPRWLADDRSVS